MAQTIFPTKSFSPSTINKGGISTLKLILVNSVNQNESADFTDIYPLGLINATPLVTTDDGGNGTIVASAGGGSFALTGATIGPLATRTLTIQVTSNKAGNYVNFIGSFGGDGTTATLIVKKKGNGFGLFAPIFCDPQSFKDGKCPNVVSYRGTNMYRMGETSWYSQYPNKK